MKKFAFALLSILLGAALIFPACAPTENTPPAGDTPPANGSQENNQGGSTVQYKTVLDSHDTIGNGGYGAVFNAKIDPFNLNYYGATCDMGSVYFSYDAGESWQRHNLKGTVYCLEYDPSAEGVVWAAGSGVYKSVDHGKTMNLVFPKESEITYEGNNYENVNYWLYTDKASDYAPQYQIWSLAINRKSGGKNVFAGQRVPSSGMGTDKCVRVYETKDGENFSLFKELDYSYNFELDYDEVNDHLLYVTDKGISAINREGETVYTVEIPVYVQHSSGNTMGYSSYYDAKNNKKTYAFSSPVNEEHVASACYKTNDLRDRSKYLDITEKLCAVTTDDFGVENVASYNRGLPSYEYCEWVRQDNKPVRQQFKWTIGYVYVHSDDVVYLFHEANTNTYCSDGSLYINRRTHIYLKYDARKESKEQFRWIYGFPLKPYEKDISNQCWPDSDSAFCFGMTTHPQHEDSFLYCTNVGIYYTADGKKVKQLYSNVLATEEVTFRTKNGTEEKKSIQRVVTTGVDVICTQMVATDPFDSSHVLMGCTDIGLLQSYDNCASWYHALYEWEGDTLKNICYAAYTNTCFDLHFDRERRGVVYGIWSLAKTAPYAPVGNYLTSPARFGISYDGGMSWVMKNITPDGCCLPYRMQVVYEGEKRSIYIATESHGFFVTHDEGETFTAMNEGIRSAPLGGKTALFGNEILVCEKGIYAITGGAATDSTAQMFYRWNEQEKKFEELGLPTSEYGGKTYTPAAVRDIVYDEKNECFYLACTANVANNYSKMVHVAGGIWKYKDGTFTQIYNEECSVFGVSLDSTGRLYATELSSRLLRFDNNNTTYEVLLDGMFHSLKGIYFGPTDNVIYVPTWGGSTERLILKEVTC